MKAETLEHIKRIEKYLYFPDKNKVSDFFVSAKKWVSEPVKEQKPKYCPCCNRKMPEKIDRTPRPETFYLAYHSKESSIYEGFRVELTEELKAWARKALCDDNDSISFEAIEWGDNETLLLASNSQIISSSWLNVIATDELKAFLGVQP